MPSNSQAPAQEDNEGSWGPKLHLEEELANIVKNSWLILHEGADVLFGENCLQEIELPTMGIPGLHESLGVSIRMGVLEINGNNSSGHWNLLRRGRQRVVVQAASCGEARAGSSNLSISDK